LHSLAFSNQTLHRQALQFSCVPNHTNLLPHWSQVGSARITALQFSRETNYTNLLPHRSQIGSARIHRYSRIVQGTVYAYMEGN
jgi:hypothetical protein